MRGKTLVLCSGQLECFPAFRSKKGKKKEGFLTRKMSRVVTISTPLIALLCQELLVLVVLWFTGSRVPFMSAIFGDIKEENS